MILDLVPENARAAGLGALMKGVGMVTRFLPIPQPTLLVGPGSSARLGQAVAGFGHRRILVVTDAVVARLGLLAPLTDALREGGAEFAVFDEVTPDAPIPLIERGIKGREAAGPEGARPGVVAVVVDGDQGHRPGPRGHVEQAHAGVRDDFLVIRVVGHALLPA